VVVAATATTVPSPRPTWLTVQGKAFRATALRHEVGARITAAAAVEEVVTHNGFWVGTGAADRVWVELVGPRRSIRIANGDRLRFVGTVTANPPSYAERAGLTASTGAAQLTRQGAHIDLPTTAVQVLAP